MKQFMGEDFLLSTETAKELFATAKTMPIFDWHCHLSPKEIYENRQPQDITALWLLGDHYKWRGMRGFGIAEDYITGEKSSEEKFKAWAAALPYMVGNPLYHWTHLELRRYFGIYEPLSAKTAEGIWKAANEKIAAGGFTLRELIEKSNVACVCTTDDAADSLEYHKLIAEDKSFKCRVIPAFRPDKALNIELWTFIPWLKDMEKAAEMEINSYADLKQALLKRIEFFAQLGCRATDHALLYVPYERATECELDAIFKKGKNGETLTKKELDQYRTELMRFFAKEYHKRNWGMEIHIGAMRNNNTPKFQKLGPDTGYDSIADREIAHGLSRLLDSLETEGILPKTILFTLNPKDNYVLGSMIGNFQSEEAASKMQFGTAWWFNDNIDGMREQIKALGNLGVLGKFIGMVTDSRSFVSYPRHEYFRRILCEFIGNLVENGEYPADMETLKEIVRDVSFNNAARYFGIDA
ncbi:MAG: glucuronate isomerase [Oscillospiraceae bacterium]|nr:glucuronate isomerase [Oscillospiraceae bacterium]